AGGPADDGATIAPSGCAAAFRPAPDPAHALLNVEATAGEGRRALDAVVARAAEPAIPALLWLSEAATLGNVAGSLILSGADPVRPGAPRAPMAAPDDPALLDAWLAAHTGGVAVQAPAAAPFRAPAPPPPELATRRRRPAGRHAGSRGYSSARADVDLGRSRHRFGGQRPGPPLRGRAPRHRGDIRV